jgi:ribosome-binding factor A
MRSRKFDRKPSALPCDEIGPDDGVDPRVRSRETSRRVPNRKALQLCGEVARTLNGILQGECDDEVLRDVLVESVVPAPDSTRLLVTVSCSPSAREIVAAEVLQHLHRVHGKLRGEVAAAIHRRKTPELVFRVAWQ